MKQKDARITKLKAKIRSFQFFRKDFFYSVFKIKNYKVLLAADEWKEGEKHKLSSDWLVKML